MDKKQTRIFALARWRSGDSDRHRGTVAGAAHLLQMRRGEIGDQIAEMIDIDDSSDKRLILPSRLLRRQGDEVTDQASERARGLPARQPCRRRGEDVPAFEGGALG